MKRRNEIVPETQNGTRIVIPMRIKNSESIFYFVHAQSLEICWLIV